MAVTVNGVAGTFIVDTGASLVAVTSAFSERANISLESDGEIRVHTANGTVQARRGRANLVKLPNSEARDVAVAVQSSQGPQGFGPGIDGLLGMSFLS